ncbi:CLC_0170 family protein [Clostridium sp. Cult1]|uniref:CLC_0170 family protein n=1 Tax=Clostridium sp. Cult1 TaxID=2079002 RepID=UPI001F3EAA77|nr:CLC_0170 family protein [Clostridium sp. Cult1]MCF6462342.1 hypothetical protein [Clostridium sp. Cult1]
MYKIVGSIKSIFDNISILIIILVALFSLLIDGPNYKNQGFIREYRIVKIISYSYIALGIIIFIFLRIT